MFCAYDTHMLRTSVVGSPAVFSEPTKTNIAAAGQNIAHTWSSWQLLTQKFRVSLMILLLAFDDIKDLCHLCNFLRNVHFYSTMSVKD